VASQAYKSRARPWIKNVRTHPSGPSGHLRLTITPLGYIFKIKASIRTTKYSTAIPKNTKVLTLTAKFRSDNMTSLFSHTPYAEDQPSAHSILYLHAVRASAMSFTFLSLFRIPITLASARYRQIPITTSALIARTLHGSGRAFALGSLVGAVATWGRMRGREEIEWQDRAWRVLENEGEVKTDWVMLGGSCAGAFASFVAARRGAIPMGVGSAMLGGAGVGSSIGKIGQGENIIEMWLTWISRHTIHDGYLCDGTKACLVVMEGLAQLRCESVVSSLPFLPASTISTYIYEHVSLCISVWRCKIPASAIFRSYFAIYSRKSNAPDLCF
jgi:hypothetical protein